MIQDSTRILMWLEKYRAPFALLPSDPEERQRVLEIEDRFDRVGKHVVRYSYAAALADPAAVLEMWTVRSSALEKRALELSFPVFEPVFRRRFKIYPEDAARSREVIAENVAWLDERVRDGRRFLGGDRFTAADVTAAALLAPLACPDQHPMYGRELYRKAMAPALRGFEDSASLAWVRKLYASDRQ